ncbi:MAG: alpha/beta hydrolase [Planctomycetota bacterium]
MNGHLPSRSALRASVIVLHGWSSRGAANLHDAEAFRGAHTEVVLPDAPGHGRRDDGRLARIAALPDAERMDAIVGIAREQAAELPALAARCRERGAARVGLVGISMGGFAALGALATPCPFDAVAAVLAAPTLVDPAAVTPGRPPLLLGLAGRDTAVPPEPGRRFAREYGAELWEYPESEHFLRGEDWRDLWSRVAGFLRRHLGDEGA